MSKKYQTTVYEPADNREHIALRLLDRPIAYHRIFVELTGSVTAAVMLSQAFYWTRRPSNAAGWFYKTQQEWTDETGLTRYEQETARKKLRKHKWWQEELRKANGSPTLHFRINISEFYRELTVFAAADGTAQIPQMDMRESNITLDMRESNNSLNIDYTETTFIEDRKRLTPGERDRASEAVLNALRDKYKANPLGSIRSRVDMERRLDEHVDLIEQYGFEEYIRALNAAIPYKDVRYASNIEAQIVRDANAAPPKLNPSEERRGVVNLQFKN